MALLKVFLNSNKYQIYYANIIGNFYSRKYFTQFRKWRHVHGIILMLMQIVDKRTIIHRQIISHYRDD